MNDHRRQQTPNASVPHRVLFIHGLFRNRFQQSGRKVADLLARRLPAPAPTISAVPELLLDDGGRCARYLLSPSTGSSEWNSVEIVEVTYDDIIAEHERRHTLLRRVFRGIRVLGETWRLFRLFRDGLGGGPRPISRQAWWALKYAGIYLAFLAGGLFVLASLVVGVLPHAARIAGFVAGTKQEIDSGTNGQHDLAVWVAVFAILTTAGRLLVSKSWAAKIEDDAASAFALIHCQRRGSKLRQELIARLRSAIVACGGVDGRKEEISVVAYSQGALLAIDALWFPSDGGTSQPDNGSELAKVRLLVTFGCPLDVVTRLWPERRQGEPEREVCIGEWINLFESTDRLGGRLSSLVEREGITTRVTDREFQFWVPSGKRWIAPHYAYWVAAEEERKCTVLSSIASTLTKGSS